MRLISFSLCILIVLSRQEHPELVYLHDELSKNAAERKELASRQRAYDAAYISQKLKWTKTTSGDGGRYATSLGPVLNFI